jgi:DNA-binding PadR family transcriptional regulator
VSRDTIGAAEYGLDFSTVALKRPGRGLGAIEVYDFIILGVLRSGRALHGYALSEAYVDDRLGGAPRDARRLYKTLKRLEGVRWITPAAIADARATVDYTIAPRGIVAFDGWFVRVERDRLHAALEARVPFVGDVPPDLAVRWAEQYERALWLRASELAESEAAASVNLAPSLMLLRLRAQARQVSVDLEQVRSLRAVLVPSAAPAAAEVVVTRPVAAKRGRR